jgi:protein-tyrosine phosphatase
MIDLHCHILPGIDDGAEEISVSLAMARVAVADGIEVVACTPHILPGLYHNSGPAIRAATAQLQQALDDAGIPLRLAVGADIHLAPDLVGGLRAGQLLALADTRYVLVEPPHHAAPARLEDVFLDLLAAGYVPILTHPERLTWIGTHYGSIVRLVASGVWMQVTAGSLAGAFGRDARYWAERMLEEGRVHILASDAHDARRRPPDLGRARELAGRRLGTREARHLVSTRPAGVLANVDPANLPSPFPAVASSEVARVSDVRSKIGRRARREGDPHTPLPGDAGARLGRISGRLRRFFA